MGLILSEKLRGVPHEVRDAFEDTTFLCECGGTVLPYTMTRGVCIHCGEESDLIDLDFETNDDEIPDEIFDPADNGNQGS